MRDEREKLIQALRTLGFGGSGPAEAAEVTEAAEKMLEFENLVLERNETINLTAITDRDEFLTKHLVDSCSCYGWPEIAAAARIVDIGTGAGFPGVPLALLYPEKQFVLIDSLGKRTDFITEAAQKLDISNVEALHMRAEDAGRDPGLRESFDLCVTRAVAALPVLEEYCLPLVKTGGFLYAYKTQNAEGELADGTLARSLLGGSRDAESRPIGPRRDMKARILEGPGPIKGAENGGSAAAKLVGPGDLPFSRRIFIIKKERPTPASYPRKAGVPAKIPL
ncbi:MAG: 16S rRNA (guanine(527)-N(7))-methyltransferase RsmG [Clostridiales Family XIII bacterium]|jgi:16S rRNA (guanine527-N7)-methyltransferase|nr:16S rRNA (guanine(527)-N(7))-methyltransferase RsmG [Clostridiales Family XIII bacterium]